MTPDAVRLDVPAIAIDQGGGRVVYVFAVDAKTIPAFAAIHRAGRDDDLSLVGYQRPEAVKHIRAIADYLESDRPMVPNSLTMSFDNRVEFIPTQGDSPVGYATPGVLRIPIPADGEPKPGHLVDGQQRTAAVREADIDSFPMPVSAFITDDDAEARAQFLLVNSTKPLPRSLIHELLPGTTAKLPRLLERKRFPAELVARLNLDDETGPLHRRIRTQTCPDGVVKDNSIMRMLENSLYEGVLYRFRDPQTGRGDVDVIVGLVNAFFGAVSDTWPEAWNSEPRRSRLVHGAGIIALGFLMDTICDLHEGDDTPTRAQFAEELALLVPLCAWTKGEWRFGPGQVRQWNELQNTSKDQQLLANHLVGSYLAIKRSRRRAA